MKGYFQLSACDISTVLPIIFILLTIYACQKIPDDQAMMGIRETESQNSYAVCVVNPTATSLPIDQMYGDTLYPDSTYVSWFLSYNGNEPYEFCITVEAWGNTTLATGNGTEKETAVTPQQFFHLMAFCLDSYTGITLEACVKVTIHQAFMDCWDAMGTAGEVKYCWILP